MNSVLQPPLPLAPENPFSSDPECIDHIGAHAHHHSSFVPEHLRRDGSFGHSSTGIPSSQSVSSITSRYNPRPEALYSGQAPSDTGSGSISTSPSSNASSALAYSYSTFTPTPAYSGHIPLANNFSNVHLPFQYSNLRRSSTMTDSSSSAMLPPTRSPGMSNHPVSPSVLGASARDNYTTSTPGLHRHPHTLSPRSDLSRYSTLPDTPRSVLPTTMPVTTSTGYGAGSVLGYATQPDRQCESPPFGAQETFHEITCEGTSVVPSIEAKVDKGFFYSGDRVWTCYRRNYFAVTVSFGLTPWVQNGRLFLNRGGKSEQIQSLAVSLAAAVDGNTGKPIELIQHTPKRDKGPQLQMKKELLSPTPPGKNHDHGGYSINSYHQSSAIPGPNLPLQSDAESAHQYSPTSHTNSSYSHNFERIQFKSATANNGKRRAQQQYYHLIVELWANIQNPRDDTPVWVKIASRSSHPVVVRGRSPSHYSNEGPHNGANARGGAGSGVGGGGYPGLGSNGAGYGGAYKNGLSGSGAAAMGGSMYRGNTYSLDPSPVASHVGSHSVSSASSMSGGPVDGLVGDQHMVDDEDSKMIEGQHNYQYYPATIYENIPQKMDASGLPLPERRIKEEYPGPASLASGWSGGGCGRFQGMETSRGYYPPDVHAHVGY